MPMFGFFEKKKVKNYFCSKCEESFDDKYLEAKGYTSLQCPFCGSLKCYELSGKGIKKQNKPFK